MRILNLVSVVIVVLIIMSQGFIRIGNAQVLPAHAHNDYLHDRPLYDALDVKFKSIEVDVFAIGDSLFVAHDFDKIAPGRTIRNLYLNPLQDIIQKNSGSVYGNGEEIILLVDFKSEGLVTYKLLHKILTGYKDILTHYKSGKKKSGAVHVIVSGNRPLDYMQQQNIRYAGYDGRISELELGISSFVMPLVSDNWSNHFSWYGKGEMPIKEKEKLQQIIETAHNKGYMFRFWGTIDRPGKYREAVWNELKKAELDLIGTDDLNGLKEYFVN